MLLLCRWLRKLIINANIYYLLWKKDAEKSDAK